LRATPSSPRSQRSSRSLPLVAPFALIALRRHGRLLAQLDALPVAPPADRPTLLLFSQDGCDACRDLPARVEEWRAEHGDDLTFDERSYDDRAAAYGVWATPAAVLIGADGRIQGEPAHGLEAIEQLVPQGGVLVAR
jgi:hypothetical protein